MSTTEYGRDPAALAWVREVRERWRALGLLAALEQAVAQVWERNVARHDPDVAGDTPLTLGITSSENLRTLLLRTAADWAPQGVLVAAPWNSLAVAHGGVVGHLMKAPDGTGARPDFAGLRWVGALRQSAAATNGLFYAPPPDDGTGQLWFEGFGLPPAERIARPRRPPDDAPDGAPGGPGAGLSHVVLVWSGNAATATTAGWLAVPYAAPAGEPEGSAWLAAVPVWAHGPDDVPAPPPVRAVSVSFGEDARR